MTFQTFQTFILYYSVRIIYPRYSLMSVYCQLCYEVKKEKLWKKKYRQEQQSTGYMCAWGMWVLSHQKDRGLPSPGISRRLINADLAFSWSAVHIDRTCHLTKSPLKKTQKRCFDWNAGLSVHILSPATFHRWPCFCNLWREAVIIHSKLSCHKNSRQTLSLPTKIL